MGVGNQEVAMKELGVGNQQGATSSWTTRVGGHELGVGCQEVATMELGVGNQQGATMELGVGNQHGATMSWVWAAKRWPRVGCGQQKGGHHELGHGPP